MARKRFVSSQISIDEDIAEIATDKPVLALMWPWFITGFDDWGRMEVTSANKVKLEIFPAFPFTGDVIQDAIDHFADVGLIFRYSHESRIYIAIEPCKYYKYQPYIREKKRIEDKSSFPAPEHPPWESCLKCRDIASIGKTLSGDKEETHEVKNPVGELFKFYQNNIGLITPYQAEQLKQYLDEGVQPEMIIAVIRDGVGKANPWDWIKKVLANSEKRNIKTIEQYEADKVQRQNQKGQGKPQNNGSARQKPTFNNFPNREYDAKALERVWLDKSKGEACNPELEQKEGESVEEWQRRLLASRNGSQESDSK